MSHTFSRGVRTRRNFGRIRTIAPMPNLIEVQKKSYDQFLHVGVPAEERADTGLQGVFKAVFPIKDFSDRAELHFVRYKLEDPKYDVEECQQRGMIYAAPLRVTLQLWIFDVDEDITKREVRDIKEQTVYIGDMPLMTANGGPRSWKVRGPPLRSSSAARSSSAVRSRSAAPSGGRQASPSRADSHS